MLLILYYKSMNDFICSDNKSHKDYYESKIASIN